jgi:enoyl-CoA hydratase/carnithine racemase
VVEDLEGAVSRTAALLGSKSGLALAIARRALREGRDFGFSEALARSEALYRSELLPSHDAQEGVRAFLEKRPPRWRDR